MNDRERSIKRVKIGFIYFIIFAIFAASLYFWIKKEETCFDKVKNQNEEDVDCGGVCRKCEKIEAENLVAVKAGGIETGVNGQWDFFAEVNNPNDAYGSEDFQYEFILKNSSGEKIFSQKGNSFILPGETKYVVELSVSSNEDFSNVEFVINDSKWIEFNEYYEKPQLKIINKRYNEDNSGEIFGSVKGILKNDSSYNFNSVKVVVILRDSSDKLLALNSTELRMVKVGEEREFVTLWPKKIIGTVEKIEVQPEVNIFDSESFMKKYFKSQSF